MAEIVLDNVTKRFPDGALAVDDIDLDIADGEFMVLVGPSGCGKSTMLRMIAGLEEMSEGDLVHRRPDVTDLPPGSRHRDGVPELRAVPAHNRGENMAFALARASLPRGRDRPGVRAAPKSCS